jgi:hypothetical protein
MTITNKDIAEILVKIQLYIERFSVIVVESDNSLSLSYKLPGNYGYVRIVVDEDGDCVYQINRNAKRLVWQFDHSEESDLKLLKHRVDAAFKIANITKAYVGEDVERKNSPGDFVITRYDLDRSNRNSSTAAMCQFHGDYFGNTKEVFCIRTMCYPSQMIVVCKTCLDSITSKIQAIE